MDPRSRLGKQLLDFGKVQYRYQEKLPRWFELRRQQVTEKRSTTQIRRTLKSWVIGSTEDQMTFELARNRPLGWKASSSVDNDKNISKTISYGPSEVITYAHYHMNDRFLILRRIFKEIKKLIPNFVPTRILDFGCGPGTAACAAVDVWQVKKIE